MTQETKTSISAKDEGKSAYHPQSDTHLKIEKVTSKTVHMTVISSEVSYIKGRQKTSVNNFNINYSIIS